MVERIKDIDILEFTEFEQKQFSVPELLRVQKGLEVAYGLIEAAKSVYRSGVKLIPLGDEDVQLDIISAMDAVDGEARKVRADAMNEFGVSILALCPEEIRAQQ